MTERFIEVLLNKINETLTCYYEEAPHNAEFLYGVVPTINLTPLDSGYSAVFDIELYKGERTDVSIETICDNLREILDGYSYQDNIIGFHVGFDNMFLANSTEQDLVFKRITFVARIF